MGAPLPAAARRAKVALSGLSALFLVLFVVPVNLQSVLFGGASDVPLVSLFVTYVRNQLLPPGWLLIEGGGLGQPTLIYAEASLALTIIIGYPLIASALFERVVPPGVEHRRRMVYALTSFASATFFAGVVFSLLFMVKFYIVSLVPLHFQTGLMLDSSGFYLAGLGVVYILVLISTLPFLLLGFARFRSSVLSDCAPKVAGLGI
jgi:hypothetical protein